MLKSTDCIGTSEYFRGWKKKRKVWEYPLFKKTSSTKIKIWFL